MEFLHLLIFADYSIVIYFFHILYLYVFHRNGFYVFYSSHLILLLFCLIFSYNNKYHPIYHYNNYN